MEEKSWPIMGDFKGHALPGSCFLLLGLGWSVKYPLLQWWRKSSKESLPSCFNTIDFVEGTSKIVFAFVGILCEQEVGLGAPLWTLLNDGDSWVALNRWQHCTMYFFFGLNGIMEVLNAARLPLPRGLHRFSLALAFFVQGFLFYHHTHGRSPLSVQLHTFLVLAVLAVSACALLETFKEEQPVLELFRCSGCIVIGSWFYQIGFVLYPNHWSGQSKAEEQWDQEAHDNLMFVTLCFCWHLAAALLVVGVNYGVIWTVMQRRAGRTRHDVGDGDTKTLLLQGT